MMIMIVWLIFAGGVVRHDDRIYSEEEISFAELEEPLSVRALSNQQFMVS